MEFFAYFCPHYNHLDPLVEGWRKTLPKMLDFHRVPLLPGHPGTRVYSRAYYLAKTLSVLKRSHRALFRKLHVKGHNFQSDYELRTFPCPAWRVRR